MIELTLSELILSGFFMFILVFLIMLAFVGAEFLIRFNLQNNTFETKKYKYTRVRKENVK